MVFLARMSSILISVLSCMFGFGLRFGASGGRFTQSSRKGDKMLPGCMSYGTFSLPEAQKDRTDPSVGRSRVRERIRARTRHQRPCRCPLRPERAALALWARPVHTSSMVESTADDYLTLDGDANALRSANLRRHRRQQDGRRSSSAPSSWRAQASPTRPEQPSLASVGGGMAAGAAFAHPRAADPRVRPIFSTISNVNVPMTHATSHQPLRISAAQ